MKKKFFDKETAACKFKITVLDDGYSDLNLEARSELWRAWLLLMSQEKLISKHSANTWTYPAKIID